MKLIPLSKNGKNKGKYFAKVDDEDFDYLNQFNWSYMKKGYAIRHIYISPKKYEYKLMHREVLNVTDKNKLCDHIDHDKLNNQKYNLRECDYSENGRNKTPRGKSKYLGVVLLRYKRKGGYYSYSWGARINYNNKNTYLGNFQNEIDAAMAYDNAAKKYHKEFANLNFKNKL